ncbi:MAG TPA: isoprenylcysteine carboxylmethyltransferase family protein [Rhodothermales bacterium]|nr:isoprenylcysteine carboxylmethyltransferase family protein [Rhodothermales bacterium]
MHGSSRPRGWTLIPPPPLFALPLVAGLFLHGHFPLVHVSDSLTDLLRWPGIGLIAVGVAHILSSAALFARSRTTIVPHRRASVIVQRGAYRWTRNPMYLGLALIYVGVSALFAALWPLLLLPLPVLVMNCRVIPMEERQMAEAFGADYGAYTARVRRWL